MRVLIRLEQVRRGLASQSHLRALGCPTPTNRACFPVITAGRGREKPAVVPPNLIDHINSSDHNNSTN